MAHSVARTLALRAPIEVANEDGVIQKGPYDVSIA